MHRQPPISFNRTDCCRITGVCTCRLRIHALQRWMTENIVIKMTGTGFLRLSDIASVGFGEQQEFIRINANGRDCRAHRLVKQQGVNLIDFAGSVKIKAASIQQHCQRHGAEALFMISRFSYRTRSTVCLNALRRTLPGHHGGDPFPPVIPRESECDPDNSITWP